MYKKKYSTVRTVQYIRRTYTSLLCYMLYTVLYMYLEFIQSWIGLMTSLLTRHDTCYYCTYSVLLFLYIPGICNDQWLYTAYLPAALLTILLVLYYSITDVDNIHLSTYIYCTYMYWRVMVVLAFRRNQLQYEVQTATHAYSHSSILSAPKAVRCRKVRGSLSHAEKHTDYYDY